MQTTPFDLFIAQYKKSNKYIDKVILRDFNPGPEDMYKGNKRSTTPVGKGGIIAPFEGSLFDLNLLTIATSLFYYVLKQNTQFLFEFKDPKSLFKQVVTRYKQFDLDLNQNPLQVYNVILASLY